MICSPPPSPGQFWNVPATVEEHNGLFNGVERDDDYNITLHYSDYTHRSFVGLKMNVTWEFERRTCYYVGNIQGGPIGELEDSNSVIEGDYMNYKVDSLFETEFPFSQFMESYCNTP